MHADTAEGLGVGVAVVQGVDELVERAHVQHAVRHVEVYVSATARGQGEWVRWQEECQWGKVGAVRVQTSRWAQS
jgi:hypothetical protein